MLQRAALVEGAKSTPVVRKECKETSRLAIRVLFLIDTSSQVTDPTIADPAIPADLILMLTFEQGERHGSRGKI